MDHRGIVAAAAGACFSTAAIAGAFSSSYPHEAYLDTAPPVTTGGPYEQLLKQVQERLRVNGFDGGPPNGTFNSKTQAALVQFQLSRTLPASGSLDDETLAALGVPPLSARPAPPP